MNPVEDKIKSFQGIWKQLSLLGVWLGTIAGTFLLPLPDWNSEEQNTSHTRFILFIATVVAGFILILIFKYKKKLFWLLSSLITFVLLIFSFYTYTDKRESNTLIYDEKATIIGDVPQKDFHKIRKKYKLGPKDTELLLYVGGETTRLWTHESIKKNRNELIFFLTVSYCLLAIFMMSFLNVIIIYTAKNEKT